MGGFRARAALALLANVLDVKSRSGGLSRSTFSTAIACTSISVGAGAAMRRRPLIAFGLELPIGEERGS
jgi:hypothetical protein